MKRLYALLAGLLLSVSIYAHDCVTPGAAKVDPAERPPFPTKMMEISFQDVWGKPLATNGRTRLFYRNREILNTEAAGTTMRIDVPLITGVWELGIVDVENNKTGGVVRVGTFSMFNDWWGRPYSTKYWGIGGAIKIRFTAEDSGKVMYFNHKIAHGKERDNWYSTLQAYFRKVR